MREPEDGFGGDAAGTIWETAGTIWETADPLLQDGQQIIGGGGGPSFYVQAPGTAGGASYRVLP